MDEEPSASSTNWVSMGVVSAVSLAAGIGIGYILWRRPKPYVLHAVPDHVDMNIDEEDLKVVVEQLEESKANHPTASHEISVAPLVEQRIKEQMTTVHEPENPVVAQNVFAENDDDWDYETEIEKRTEQAPYVLHKDEFYQDEKNYTQTTMTYYAVDNILTDQEDTPVYNHGHIIGPMLFGHGSGDPKVFYVRNDKRHEEYEIVHFDGLYSVEILGLEIEDNQRVKDIKHSSNPLKFRESD